MTSQSYQKGKRQLNVGTRRAETVRYRAQETKNKGTRPSLKWEVCSEDKFSWDKVSWVRDSPSWENSHGISNLTLSWEKPSGDKPSWVNYTKLVNVPM